MSGFLCGIRRTHNIAAGVEAVTPPGRMAVQGRVPYYPALGHSNCRWQ